MGNKACITRLTLATSALLLTPIEVGAEATVPTKDDISPGLSVGCPLGRAPSSHVHAPGASSERATATLTQDPPLLGPLPEASIQATAVAPLKATIDLHGARRGRQQDEDCEAHRGHSAAGGSARPGMRRARS